MTTFRAALCASLLLLGCAGHSSATAPVPPSTGVTSGASSTGASATVESGGSASGFFESSGTAAAGASGQSGSSSSTATTSECLGPTRYVDDAGVCRCAANAYSLDGGVCTCPADAPLLCKGGTTQAPDCVDPTTDPNSCGGCGVSCALKAACNGGVCGQEPSTLVRPRRAACRSTSSTKMA
jgi:hypothetical protein